MLSAAQSLPELLVYGASGHAKVVIDAIEKSGLFTIQLLVDDNPALKGLEVYGYTVAGGQEVFQDRHGLLLEYSSVVAIGNNDIRAKIARWLEEQGGKLCAPVVHPSAQIARGASIGDGTVVMAGAVINADACIGKNVIVNSGAIIEHDCIIGDAVHVAPGATLCGGVRIGDGTLVGAGAVIHPNRQIGHNVTIGAGATVLDNLPDEITVAGTPAKQIR
jgi:sugar O-acyltransferase (sialic acid O-acetyltransferase NeuD family)